MPSELDSAKRGLVKLLRSLAEKHGVQLVLTRDSTNKQVQQAFRKIALKVHPDKGGELAVFQELSNMMDAWQDLLKKSESAGPGRRPKEDAKVRFLVIFRGLIFTLKNHEFWNPSRTIQYPGVGQNDLPDILF